jgi:hypothetical protein
MVELIGNTAADPVKGSRSRSADGLFRILVATLFGLFIVLAWVGLPFEVPYIGYGLVSAFVFQVAVRPRRWEIVGVVLGGAALALFDQLVVHQGSRPDFQISSCFGFLGLVSFLFVGFRAVWAVGPERQQFKLILIPAAALAFFVIGSQRLLNLPGLLFPNTLDLYAYSFDGSLGFQPSFVVGRWFRDYPVVEAVGRFTYYSLPLPMALVYAAHLRLRKTAPLFIFEIFMAAGLLGYFLYLTFPAAGPVYLVGSAFPGFPLSLSDLRALPLRTIPISVAIPRNAMPSLHLTWALLIWFNSKPLSRLASALAFTLVLTTVFDTIGMGEHYFIDLVVALPFAVAVQALCTRSFELRSSLRFAPLMGGATLTLLWLIMLRYGIRIFLLTPLIPWACVISSTALVMVWMKQILSAEQSEPRSTAGAAQAIAARM